MTNYPDFDQWWDYKNPHETAKKFKKLLETEGIQGNKEYLACILSQLARTESLQRNFEAAHQYLNQMEEIPNFETFPLAQTRHQLERGRTYNSNQQRALAISCFEKAYEIALENKLDFYMVDAAHMLGIACPVEEQLKWNERAIALAQSSKDDKASKWMGSLLNNSGWILFDQKKYEEALGYFEKCLDFQVSHHKNPEARIARWSIAKMKRFLGETKLALQMQQELLASAPKDDDSPYVHEEIGECLLVLNRKQEASPHFLKAWEVLSKDIWLQANESERLERLRDFSL